jgi:hypothetical protein
MKTQKGPGQKYMQVLDPKIYRQLRQRAKPLGITVQELIRVKIIPEFLFGALELNPRLVERLLKDGHFKNGRRPKLSR